MAFLRVLLYQIEKRDQLDAKAAADLEAAAPVPVTGKRILVKGEVVSIKNAEFEAMTRILVKTTDGYKLYGSRPTSIINVKRGDVIEFSASVKPSATDAKFGFFSRPTKARVLVL